MYGNKCNAINEIQKLQYDKWNMILACDKCNAINAME